MSIWRADSDSPADPQDQLAFFDAMLDGARRAEARAGSCDHHFSVAGKPVTLKVSGEGFNEKLPTAFSHLARLEEQAAALTIHAWEDESTGTTLPRLVQRYLRFVEVHCFDFLGPRNEIKDFHGQRIRAIMHMDPVIISLFDPVRSMALYWTRDVTRIPVWDWGTPLRIILNEFAKQHHNFLVHCAAVGNDSGGVILAGKSGSGKSTAALACLSSGALQYAGDDYCLVSETDPTFVHSLYCSAKLKGEVDFERFPQFRSLVANREFMDEQKALLFLRESYGDRISNGFPLKAIVVPRVTGLSESSIEPSSGVNALKALAPSTLLQLPGDGKQTMTSLSRLVHRVPAYTLNAGTDLPGLAACLENLMAELG